MTATDGCDMPTRHGVVRVRLPRHEPGRPQRLNLDLLPFGERPDDDHSARNAMIGSMREARSDGSRHATIAIKVKRTVTAE